jgi:hypothetical protein
MFAKFSLQQNFMLKTLLGKLAEKELEKTFKRRPMGYIYMPVKSNIPIHVIFLEDSF